MQRRDLPQYLADGPVSHDTKVPADGMFGPDDDPQELADVAATLQHDRRMQECVNWPLPEPGTFDEENPARFA